jgi:hypothetical protein
MKPRIQIPEAGPGIWRMPKMAQNNMIAYINDPTRSKRSPAESAHSCATPCRVRTIVAKPIGTLIRNIAGQPNVSVRKPPRKGPMERPA